MDLIDQIKDAKLILVPKGDDSMPCLEAFEKAASIKVPAFKGRKLETRVNGRTFIKVKGRDIPRLIAAGRGDAGMTGSDSCEEFDSGGTIAYQACGPLMCRFVLLAPRGTAAAAKRRIREKTPVKVATSFPALLAKCAAARKLRLAPAVPVSGSLEIMPRLLDVPLVADLVSTGTTARDNNLVEVETLLDVYPAIVARNRPEAKNRANYEDVNRIDETLAKRSSQVNDQTANSPTLKLLRDSNLAGKKVGEEFAETLMAIFGPGTAEECENEIADAIYTQLVAARSRGKPAELGNIVRILINRNQKGGWQ